MQPDPGGERFDQHRLAKTHGIAPHGPHPLHAFNSSMNCQDITKFCGPQVFQVMFTHDRHGFKRTQNLEPHVETFSVCSCNGFDVLHVDGIVDMPERIDLVRGHNNLERVFSGIHDSLTSSYSSGFTPLVRLRNA